MVSLLINRSPTGHVKCDHQRVEMLLWSLSAAH
jgi:hypothetical protein